MIHNEYMQENTRINQQDRQKITFHGSANPKISQQCTPATHTEAVHCQGSSWGFSIPVSDHRRLLDPLFRGEGHQASRQLSDASTSIKHKGNRMTTQIIKRWWCRWQQ